MFSLTLPSQGLKSCLHTVEAWSSAGEEKGLKYTREHFQGLSMGTERVKNFHLLANLLLQSFILTSKPLISSVDLRVAVVVVTVCNLVSLVHEPPSCSLTLPYICTQQPYVCIMCCSTLRLHQDQDLLMPVVACKGLPPYSGIHQSLLLPLYSVLAQQYPSFSTSISSLAPSFPI